MFNLKFLKKIQEEEMIIFKPAGLLHFHFGHDSNTALSPSSLYIGTTVSIPSHPKAR